MYEVFLMLLDQRGLTVADVCRATGISQSTMSNWKKRRSLLSGKNVQILAEFFGVSVGFLMTGQEEGPSDPGKAYYISEETAETAQEILENKELRQLFDAARDASPEDLRAVHDMLMALKRKDRK